MREIKFRVWDKDLKSMCYEPICDAGLINAQFVKPEDSPTIIMQYTELKDKNGKEIYEDDILRVFVVKSAGYLILKVWYLAPEWGLSLYKDGKPKGYFQMSNWGYGKDVDDFEVIGNIYENPELLEAK